MSNIKLFFFLFLAIFSTLSVYAQQSKYDISAPVDLKETGVNKVLCMQNGNTMLFHLEPDKSITVIVYDSLHKKITSADNVSKLLDYDHSHQFVFKGLYEIGNAAVLFMEQSPRTKRQLIMLKFDEYTGATIEEKLVREQRSVAKHMDFYVMKNKNIDGYAILISEETPQFDACIEELVFYNNKNEEIRTVTIPVDRKPFDYMEIKGAEAQENGNCITMCLYKIATNATTHGGGVTNSKTIYDHVVLIAYVPLNTGAVREKMIDLSTNMSPYFSNYTYNRFTATLNVLLFNYQEFLTKNGLDVLQKALQSALFFSIDPTDMSVKHNWFKNDSAIQQYKTQTDTSRSYEGVPVKMFTNENGLSTIISQSFTEYDEVESKRHPNAFCSYFGKIAVTQCDDDGKEIWGTLLPLAQYYKSYNHFYFARDLSKRWQEQNIFADFPPAVYDRQFVSLNTCSFNKNLYIIYNDNNENFNNSITRPGDTVYSFQSTNACYYKLNKKREITKSYLFGEPAANEYRASFIEGADFDGQRGIYASLVQYRKEGKTTLCMAWCQLD